VTRPHPIGATPIGESVTVADTPVNPIVCSVGAIAPTAAVAETPVNPIICSVGEIAPTAEVAESPVG